MARRILDTFKDADGLPVTATFAAFMIENGYRTYREAQDSGAYADWMTARWREFAEPAGIKGLVPVDADRVRFIDWLNDRAVDQIARNAVEAA
jgi:hypothetical protein